MCGESRPSRREALAHHDEMWHPGRIRCFMSLHVLAPLCMMEAGSTFKREGVGEI